MQKLVILTMLLWGICNHLKAQDSSTFDNAFAIPGNLLTHLGKKASDIQGKLNKQTNNYLNRLQKQENKLKKRLFKRDSLLTKKLFSDVDERYQQLKNTSGNVGKYQGVYSGRLDSVFTALNFLNEKEPNSNPQIQQVLARYKDLQTRINASEQVRKQIVQRQQQLKEQFQKLGMVKELRLYQKEAFYYSSQIKEYKQLLDEPERFQNMLIKMVLKIPRFKEFFAQNSVLGSLFALPGSGNSAAVSTPGLQSRAMVNQNIVDRFGSGPAVNQQLQQNLQAAQGQLSELTNKVGLPGTGSYGNSNSDVELPKGFKPNTQKTKPFLNRIEVGTNIQTQGARYGFPATSDLGLSLGYKINDKSIIGVGAAYKLGMGTGWNHITLTHQGVGLRSFLDYKIKGAFYISGGYEQNYRSAFENIDQLKHNSNWQSSGLIGIGKKYKVSKKFKGDIKFLWDFLSYQQIPRTQPLLFRLGYGLK